MEQKKILWIIAAVGTFLLVVLGTAGILYSPSKNPVPTVSTVSLNNKTSDNKGWTNNPDEEENSSPVSVQNTTTQEANDVVIVSKNTKVYDIKDDDLPVETTIDLNALKSELNVQNQLKENKESTEKINNENKNQNADNAGNEEVLPLKTSVNESQKTVSAKTETAPVREKPVSKKKPAQAVTTQKKAENTNTTKYWIQVASYSNKKGAESAKEILSSNRITSDIFTYTDSKNNLYYRVRIGPYTTKNEAEYWKDKVLKIPYFEKSDSYITSTNK